MKAALVILSLLFVPLDARVFDHKLRTIEAELVEMKPFESDCGDLVFYYMFKYKIAKWSIRKREEENIYVIHKCIEFKQKGFFVVGGLYRIELKSVPSQEKFLKSNIAQEIFVSVNYKGGKIYFGEDITLVRFPISNER